jgi:hypothetical protein
MRGIFALVSRFPSRNAFMKAGALIRKQEKNRSRMASYRHQRMKMIARVRPTLISVTGMCRELINDLMARQSSMQR